MSGRTVSQLVAGTWVFVVLSSPALVVWWAHDGGSIGDLSELELLTSGLVVAVATAVVAALLMGRAHDLAARDPAVGRLDPWAALFVASAVLGSVVIVVPAATLVLLLPEEDTALSTKEHWLVVVWVAGTAGAALASLLAGRAVLRHGHRRRMTTDA